MERINGKVYLVGAGPGDPNLITVRGRRLVHSADIVVMDALVNPRIVQGIKGKIIFAGKRGNVLARHATGAKPDTSQDAINRMLIRLAKQGKRVVRLKGGDPFVFGRGSEEVEALNAAGVPSEVVPGVSSAIAAPAAAGIPVTDRRWASQVTFVTGHGQARTRGADPDSPEVDWNRLSPRGTLVVLMGVASWKNIRHKLLSAGWSAALPVAAIESGTNADQRVIRSTLGESATEFERRQLMAPAVIVVGDVVRLGLRAKPIVVTRPVDQSAELISLLKKRGWDVISAPSIRVQPLKKPAAVVRRHYDWIIFLSSNAVRTFGRNGKRFQRTAVMVVGPETKRVAEQHGWRVRRIPKRFSSMGVLAALGSVKGKRILVPRVQSAPRNLPASLRARGAHVDELATYETLPARFPNRVKARILRGVEAITFTSASTVRGFAANFAARERKAIFDSAAAVSMGPQTTAALRRIGARHIREAKNSTIPDLIEAIGP